MSLSLWRMSGLDAGKYLTSQVARGAEDYYAGRGEAPGEWFGGSAEALGLVGRVDHGDFGVVLEGVDPGTGERLGTQKFRPDRVSGWDWTFAAPKSVSAVWAVADREVAGRIERAHGEAVREALGLVEREAARGRRGRNGARQIGTRGLVGSTWLHRTSRAGDPHLHTHAVVANVVLGEDGKWCAPDGRELLRWRSGTRGVYDAVFRAKMQEMGYVTRLEPGTGAWDIAGVPSVVREEWSTRAREIREHMSRVGLPETSKSMRCALLATRQKKSGRLETSVALRERWRREAAGMWWGGEQAEGIRGKSQVGRQAREEEFARLFAGLAGPGGATERQTSVAVRDVVAMLCERAQGGVRDAREVMDKAVAWLKEEAVRLENPRQVPPWNSCRGGVVQCVSEARWTTQEMLEEEERCLAALGRLAQKADMPVGSSGLVPAVALEGLSSEQLGAVEYLAQGPLLRVLQGPGGAGKTYIAAAARDRWAAEGRDRLLCVAPTALGAENLAGALGMKESMTLAFLRRRIVGETDSVLFRDGERTVVVVDEAGMAGTRDLRPLLEHAEQYGWKVVLIGDPRQLSSVGAGGIYAAACGRYGAYRLEGARRQRNLEEREALAAVRAGEVEAAVGWYEREGRVRAFATKEAADGSMVSAWAEDAARHWYRDGPLGELPVMLAAKNEDVDKLNTLARARLEGLGVLPVCEPVCLGGREWRMGDRVLLKKNDRDIGALNGQRGALVAFAAESGQMKVALDDGAVLWLPRRYVEEGGVRHGWAATVHSAQGQTVSSAYVFSDGSMYAELAYTALSRSRGETYWYAVAGVTKEAIADLERALGRSAGGLLAVEQSPAEVERRVRERSSHLEDWKNKFAMRVRELRGEERSRNIDRGR